MTVKELSIEVEKLKQSDVEKDNLIKSLDEKISFLQNWAQDFCNKTNEMNQHSTNNVKILDDKINEVEGKVEKIILKQKVTVTEKPTHFKCRECSFELLNISDLKIHIQAVHPKKYTCKNCDQIFDTSLDFEIHMKTHSAEKTFKCELCEQSFYVKWRLSM